MTNLPLDAKSRASRGLSRIARAAARHTFHFSEIRTSLRRMATFDADVDNAQQLVIIQRKELAELFGFESRNKYEIRTLAGQPVGFAAEQQKGLFGFLLRQFFGHWRSFELTLFDMQRAPVLFAHHPFRWFFTRLTVTDRSGRLLGAIERRWSWLSKRFDVLDAQGHVLLTVESPLWHPWTFAFRRLGNLVGAVKKRWSGGLTELFTDADNFLVDYLPGPLTGLERRLLLAAALFIDLVYFEQKARN